MPGFIGTLGMDVLSKGIGAAIGGVAAQAADRRQLKQQEKLQQLAMEGSKEMINFQKAADLQMWRDTNAAAQVQMMKDAGLSVGLMYGKGGGGGATIGGSSGVGMAQAPSGGGEMMSGMGMMNVAQLALLNAQKENIEADTANKQANTGVQIEQKELLVLEQVIKDFAGKEAKDMYERVTAPARAVQAKTYQDELEARQGIAGTIYELWAEGKLKEKGLAEIENLVLGNLRTKAETANKEANTELTRAEIRNVNKQFDILEENLKGLKLDNVIKDLEAKLQTQTGLDRNSPTWMKLLGRLFVGLFGN